MTHSPHDPITRVIEPISQAVKRLRSEGVGRRWVVAVSGGPDSVGMLRALVLVRDQEQVIGERLELSVAHLDHGLRGREGEADGAFVAELAKQLDLPFDLGHWSPKRTHHIESDARAARYAWLAEVAQNRSAEAVAVAHTRDDQAETVLHRILRGTGPNSLAGMSLRRPLKTGIDLVRPLLKIRRADLAEFLQTIGQSFRIDASNLDLRRTRNRIRQDLLPKLEQDYNPKIVETLARLADLVEAESLDRAAQVLESQTIATIEQRPESITFDLKIFKNFSPNIRAEILRLSWRQLRLPERSMSAKIWEACALFAERTQGRIDLPGGATLSVGEGQLILARKRNEPNAQPPLDPPVPIPLPGSALWKSWGISVSLEEIGSYNEVIDADRLAPPLLIDSPRPTDRFDPIGMGGQTTPLADFLRGRGYKKTERTQIPIVRDRLGIIWVVGHRIADRVGLTAKTTHRLWLKATRTGPELLNQSPNKPSLNQ